MLAFVSFAPALYPFGEGTEMRCVLHACISYVFIGTLARRKKTILSQLAIIIRVRHDTPHSLKSIAQNIRSFCAIYCSNAPFCSSALVPFLRGEQFYTDAIGG
jgi:hypothetical protein